MKRSRRNHSAKFKARIALEALKGRQRWLYWPPATGCTPPSRIGALGRRFAKEFTSAARRAQPALSRLHYSRVRSW